MEAKIIGLNTTSSVITESLNSDLHFAKERVKEFSVLGNPKRFVTTPTEIRQANYKKAAAHLRTWLTQSEKEDTKKYDELEAELSKGKISFRED